MAPMSVERKAQVESAALTLAQRSPAPFWAPAGLGGALPSPAEPCRGPKQAAAEVEMGRERSEMETEEGRQGDVGACAQGADEMFKRFDPYLQTQARRDLDVDAPVAPMPGKEQALRSAVEQDKEKEAAATRAAGSAASAAATAAQVATMAIGAAAAAAEAAGAEMQRRKDEETRRAVSKLMTDALPVLLVVDPDVSMSTTRLALAEAAQHLKNKALTEAANSRQKPAIGRRPPHDVLVADGGVTATREHKAER